MHPELWLHHLTTHLTAWQWPVAYVAMGFQAATIAAILYKRFARRWPSVLTYLLIELISSAGGMALLRSPGHYRHYYVLYWSATLAELLTEVWIAIDIWRSFQAIHYLPNWFTPAAGSFALLAGAFAGYASWTFPTFNHHLLTSMLSLYYAVAICWASFYAALLLSVRSSGIGWNHLGARMTQGIVFKIAVSVVVAAGQQSPVPSDRAAAGALDALCEFAVLTLWTFAVLASSHTPPAPPLSEQETRALTQMQHFAEQQES